MEVACVDLCANRGPLILAAYSCRESFGHRSDEHPHFGRATVNLASFHFSFCGLGFPVARVDVEWTEPQAFPGRWHRRIFIPGTGAPEKVEPQDADGIPDCRLSWPNLNLSSRILRCYW